MTNPACGQRWLCFLFDTLSPVAWLSWNRFFPLAERRAWRVEPVPLLLDGRVERRDSLPTTALSTP